jgi:hypothetical protein
MDKRRSAVPDERRNPSSPSGRGGRSFARKLVSSIETESWVEGVSVLPGYPMPTPLPAETPMLADVWMKSGNHGRLVCGMGLILWENLLSFQIGIICAIIIKSCGFHRM